MLVIYLFVIWLTIAGVAWWARRSVDPKSEIGFFKISAVGWLLSSVALTCLAMIGESHVYFDSAVQDLKIIFLSQLIGFFVPCLVIYGLVTGEASMLRWMIYSFFLTMLNAFLCAVASVALSCSIKGSC